MLLKGLIVTLIVCIGQIGLAQNAFCPGHPDNPQLLTPNVATCIFNSSATGSTTSIELTDNAIISWPSFDQASGDVLEFNFVNNDSSNSIVLNQFTAFGRSVALRGTTESNGVVAFQAANLTILARGDINAAGAILTNYNIDNPNAFIQGNETLFTPNQTSNVKNVSVAGNVTASNGSILLAGDRATISGNVTASNGDVTVISGNQFEYSYRDSLNPNIQIEDEANGSVSNSGVIQGKNVRIHASKTILNTSTGLIRSTGNQGKVFLTLDSDLEILSDGDVEGIIETNTLVRESALFLNPNDDPTAVSGGVRRYPSLKDPKTKKKLNKGKVVYKSNQAVITADNTKKKKRQSSAQVAQARDKVIRRSSFFGLRGE